MAGKEKSQGKLPLRLRLKAWWEGYDSDEVSKRYQERIPPEEAPVAEEKKPDTTSVQDPDIPVDPWDAEKINIAQYIWGDGFCGPGGPEYIVSLSKLLALSPEMSMIQIGAGIGGPARVLADKFGVWINGYEDSEGLVEAGNELSIRAGLDKKVQLEYYQPEEFEGFDRKFDRAMAKEALFTVENKKNIIESIAEKLKPGGLLLITDLVIQSDAVLGKDRYKEWKVGERRNPYPVLSNEYQEMIKEAKLQVRVAEDISHSYIEMINKAWAGADDAAARLLEEENGTAMIQTLMREAEFWTRRKKLLEAGDLQLWRFVANKKSGGPGMMSDW